MDSSIVTRAPLVFIGFFSICTRMSWPFESRSEIFLRRRVVALIPGTTTSLTWRKPFLGAPKSTKAASMAGRMLSIRAL
jgi:hypothetical protein